MDKNIANKKWNAMPFYKQMGNIGSEVHRALTFHKTDRNYIEYYGKAVELIGRTIQNPKNKGRVNELVEAIVQLNDYIINDNSFNNTGEGIFNFLNLKKNGFARKEPFFRKLQRQEAEDISWNVIMIL